MKWWFTQKHFVRCSLLSITRQRRKIHKYTLIHVSWHSILLFLLLLIAKYDSKVRQMFYIQQQNLSYIRIPHGHCNLFQAMTNLVWVADRNHYPSSSDTYTHSIRPRVCVHKYIKQKRKYLNYIHKCKHFSMFNIKCPILAPHACLLAWISWCKPILHPVACLMAGG